MNSQRRDTPTPGELSGTNPQIAGPAREYRPPVEKICDCCGQKFVGYTCPMNACRYGP